MLFYLGGSLFILLLLVAVIWAICSQRFASRPKPLFLLAAAFIVLVFVVLGFSRWNRQLQLLQIIQASDSASSVRNLTSVEGALLRQMSALPLPKAAIGYENKQDGALYHYIIRQEAQTYVVTLRANPAPFYWTPYYTIESVSPEIHTPALDKWLSFDDILFEALQSSLMKYNIRSGSCSYEPDKRRILLELQVVEAPTQAEAVEMIAHIQAQIAALVQYKDADTLLKPYQIGFTIKNLKDGSVHYLGHKDLNATSIVWGSGLPEPRSLLEKLRW